MSKKEKKNSFWYIFFSVLLSWIALSAFIIHDGRNKFSTAAKSHPEGVFYKQGEWNVAIFLGFISSITCKISLTLMANFHWNICNPFENKITEKIHLRERNILGIVVSAYEINLL